MKKLSLHNDEQDEFTPMLEKASRITPFTVPEGYFDELPARIITRMSNNKKQNTAFEQILNFLFKPQYAVSMLLVLFLLVLTITQKSSKPILPSKTNQVQVQVAVDLEVINESYMIDQFDESEIVGYLVADPDFSKISLNKDLEAQVLSDTCLTKTEIINYLIENNDIESELLYN